MQLAYPLDTPLPHYHRMRTKTRKTRERAPETKENQNLPLLYLSYIFAKQEETESRQAHRNHPERREYPQHFFFTSQTLSHPLSALECNKNRPHFHPFSFSISAPIKNISKSNSPHLRVPPPITKFHKNRGKKPSWKFSPPNLPQFCLIGLPIRWNFDLLNGAR